MGQTIYVGLAVTAHNNQNVNTSTFTNVTVTRPAAKSRPFGTGQNYVPPQGPPSLGLDQWPGKLGDGDPAAGGSMDHWQPGAGFREPKENAGGGVEPARQAPDQRRGSPVELTVPLELPALAAPGPGLGICSGKPTKLDRLESSPDGADGLFALWKPLDDWWQLAANAY
jgi:hypothetical protein